MIEQDAITNELFNLNKEETRKLMDYVFDSKHDSLYVDLSLHKSGNYIFHKNFNRLEIDKK